FRRHTLREAGILCDFEVQGERQQGHHIFSMESEEGEAVPNSTHLGCNI
ncbi:hypothetical protein AVEN_161744-1, partial [Araneus ventricosus]